MQTYKTARVSRQASLDLEAGHVYQVKTDACYTFCFGMASYTTYLWIEDKTTGQAISGEKS